MKNVLLKVSLPQPGLVAALLALFFCVGQSAIAQVTYVGFASATNTNSSTLTVPNVNPSGTNKLLLVAVGVGSTDAIPSTPPTVTSVTYNGTSMSLVQATIGSETRCNLYSLVAPVDGPFNVVVTTSSSTMANGDPIRITAQAAWFTGVHQMTPLGTPNFVESSGSASTLNLTLASTDANDLIYSAVSVDEGASSQGITVAAGQTTIANQSGNAAISSASSREPGTGAAVTSTYTFDDGQDHSGIIVAIKRAVICTLPNCGTVTLVKNP